MISASVVRGEPVDVVATEKPTSADVGTGKEAAAKQNDHQVRVQGFAPNLTEDGLSSN